MAISRLRLHLTALFGLAVLVGLVAMALSLFLFVRHRASEQMTEQLTRAAVELAASIDSRTGREGRRARRAARDELEEILVGSDEVRAVYDSAGLVGYHGDRALLDGWQPPTGADTVVVERTGGPAGATRLAVVRVYNPPLSVVAGRTKAGLAQEARSVTLWLLVSMPVAVLLALAGGYALAARAFEPVRRLAAEIDAVDPAHLDKTLSTRTPPDEIDQLAERFNRLLGRLDASQRQNRRFLADVAHQLKTPLTVVRGESALALGRERTAEESRQILQRIERAAHQMAHRVDDLFLLAHADLGERPATTDDIELDGLALECADLMRGRASQHGARLELDRVEPGTARGNAGLVRELLLELIENAIRHGDVSEPIRISAFVEGGVATVAVASAGRPIANVRRSPERPREVGGLGLSIVEWIVQAHEGRLRRRHDAGVNTFAFEWAANGGSRAAAPDAARSRSPEGNRARKAVPEEDRPSAPARGDGQADRSAPERAAEGSEPERVQPKESSSPGEGK